MTLNDSNISATAISSSAASSSTTTTTSTSSAPAEASIEAHSLMSLSRGEYEDALFAAHRAARTLSKNTDKTEQVLIAKLAVLAVRELHASGIYPRTAIRAMVHMEFDTEGRTTGGAIKRAVREITREDRERRAEANGVASGADGSEVTAEKDSSH